MQCFLPELRGFLGVLQHCTPIGVFKNTENPCNGAIGSIYGGSTRKSIAQGLLQSCAISKEGVVDNDELKQLVEKALADVVPTREEILEAITEGVRLAFDQVYGTDILNAIADGAKEALAKKK